MRLGLGLSLAIGLFATSAHADCGPWSPDIVQLTSWEAELFDDGAYRLRIEFENTSEKAIKMVEGGAYFRDPLDRMIAGYKLDPDLLLAPKEAGYKEWPRSIDISGTPRIAVIDPADVTAIICIEAVVYADGTVERFPIAR